MNKFSVYFNESLEVPEEVIQLRKEARDVDGLVGAEKKALAAKYGTANKIKDIQHAIYLKLQELRRNRKEFNEDDLNDFYHLWESTAQMVETLKNESPEFINFYKDSYFERIKKAKLERWAGLKSFSGLSFSSREKSMIKTYQAICNFILSQDPKHQAETKKVADTIEMLEMKLTGELEEFKQVYLKRVEKNADFTYAALPKEIEEMEKILKKKKADWEIKKKEIKHYMARWQAEEPIRKYERELNKKKAVIKRYPTKQNFIEACLKDAEETFKYNVKALAGRLESKKFDINKLTVENVKSDPKIFELFVSDGSKKIYCRSILAAQFSDKMIPHFRFIMTERK